MTPRTYCTVSVMPDCAQAAKAPSGRARAEDVPTVHRPSKPRDGAADTASLAIRLFPTPAAPLTRIPATSGAEMAASMAAISSERPTNGHDKRTNGAYLRPTDLRLSNGRGGMRILRR